MKNNKYTSEQGLWAIAHFFCIQNVYIMDTESSIIFNGGKAAKISKMVNKG